MSDAEVPQQRLESVGAAFATGVSGGEVHGVVGQHRRRTAVLGCGFVEGVDDRGGADAAVRADGQRISGAVVDEAQDLCSGTTRKAPPAHAGLGASRWEAPPRISHRTTWASSSVRVTPAPRPPGAGGPSRRTPRRRDAQPGANGSCQRQRRAPTPRAPVAAAGSAPPPRRRSWSAKFWGSTTVARTRRRPRCANAPPTGSPTNATPRTPRRRRVGAPLHHNRHNHQPSPRPSSPAS